MRLCWLGLHAGLELCLQGGGWSQHRALLWLHHEPLTVVYSVIAAAAPPWLILHLLCQTVEMRATLDSMKDMLADLKERKAVGGGALSLAELRGELRNLAMSLGGGCACLWPQGLPSLICHHACTLRSPYSSAFSRTEPPQCALPCSP